VTILALDTSASRTGWCLGPSAGPVVTGSAAFKGHGLDIGSLLAGFRTWLRGMVEAHDPHLLAFEQPVRPFAAANLLTMRQLYGIAGMVELVARDKGLPVLECKTNQMKKLIYGHGGKKPTPSVAMQRAREWGIETSNGDESDAAGIYLFTVMHRYPADFMKWEHRRRESQVMNGSTLV
jgi:Holliday junction resolvasome RuvABC endonuclease subunit